MHSVQINRLTLRIAAVVLLAMYAHFWTRVQLHFLFHHHDHSHPCITDSTGDFYHSWLEEPQDDCDFCHQVAVTPFVPADLTTFTLFSIIAVTCCTPALLTIPCFSTEVSVQHNRGPPFKV